MRKEKRLMAIAVIICLLQAVVFTINVAMLVSHVNDGRLEVEAFDEGDFVRGEDLQYLVRVDGNIDDVEVIGDGAAFYVCPCSDNEAVLTVRTSQIEKFPCTVSVVYGSVTREIFLN